jgi:outer membrane PBP1 activator LpoA protein
LALNDIEKPSSNNLYRFSVDPQNEARQLAYYVHNKSLRRALVIAPKGPWGESIANAFNHSWQQLNGETSDTLLFENKADINGTIRDFLGVAHSHDRYSNLVRTLWKRPKFYARRRQDFDVVILLSYPSMARQIRPMLNYYYAGDLPIYGTSLLYSGSPKPRQDADLNGVIFAEMPYLLDKHNTQISKAWPEQFNSYNRLFAMGKDAYLLSHQLNLLTLFPMMGVTDNTGTLFIDNQQQIVRQLSWAQFKKGVVQPLKIS